MIRFMACNDWILCLIACRFCLVHFVVSIFGQKLDIPVFYIVLKVIEFLVRIGEVLTRIRNYS